MNKYLQQLLADIKVATENITWPYVEKESESSIFDWMPDHEEEKTAPRIPLEEWTGIQQQQLPPADLLNEEQIEELYEAISKMLSAHNYHATFLFGLDTRIRYEVIRQHYKQEAIQKRIHMGFFDLCFTNKSHPNCLMGVGCHCAYFEELSKNWTKEDLSPEEERRRALEIELQLIRRKYGDDYMKYYPYHLDPEYDDENGNPHDDYGFGDLDEEDEDDWWKK